MLSSVKTRPNIALRWRVVKRYEDICAIDLARIPANVEQPPVPRKYQRANADQKPQNYLSLDRLRHPHHGSF